MPNQSEYEKLWNLIKPIKFGMFSTLQEGSIHSRPMGLVQDEFNGKLYFFTKDDSLKAAEVNKNHQVAVNFSEPKDQTYVSLSGEAKLTKDKELIEKFWHPMVEAYFKEGKNDPHLALLEMDVEFAEFWDSDKSKMARLWEMGKAALGNKKPDMGEHQRIH